MAGLLTGVALPEVVTSATERAHKCRRSTLVCSARNLRHWWARRNGLRCAERSVEQDGGYSPQHQLGRGGVIAGALSRTIGGAVTTVGADQASPASCGRGGGILAIGFLPSVAQWLILRRQAGASWWILVNGARCLLGSASPSRWCG